YQPMQFEPGNYRFRRRLDPVDADWQETEAREVSFSNLPPGRYTFRVQAAAPQGAWGPEARLAITIFPPWWRTWWAYLLWGTLALGSLLFLRSYELRRRLAQAEAERLARLDRAKSELFTNITHEFRTPLTIILGQSNQLMERGSHTVRTGLESIRRNAAQLLFLVNQMLDLAKLEASYLELRPVRSDVIAFLGYLCQSYRSMAESKKVRLHFLPDTDSLEMDFDPLRLQQVLVNLLSNAIKFTPAGGNVYVQVNVHGRELILKVRDTGVGIPAEILPRIFERFFQGESHTARRWEGTGVGLALARDLVRKMQGRIEVSSQEGKGTEFTVTLPVRTQAPARDDHFADLAPSWQSPPEEIALLQENSTEKKGDAPLILLVEDNPDLVRYLVGLLNGRYSLEVAFNGQQGLDKARKLLPDLVLSDVMMPEMDGFELCRKLKTEELTCHIPVVLLTAKADEHSRFQGLETGADHYLSKPFSERELEIVLRKSLEQRRRMQAKWRRALEAPYLAPNPAHPSEEHDRRFLEKIRTIILENIQDSDFSVQDLAQRAATSRSQLHRKLKALTDFSPQQFIRKIRLDKARRLLRETDLSIAHIALECGFNDASYFARIFSKEIGQTPTAFRNQPSRNP
ncbi:MAG: helix-turn-helix domain-containing protein, partial [Bacteroidetes bacterium]